MGTFHRLLVPAGVSFLLPILPWAPGDAGRALGGAPPEATFIRGDVNGDGILDLSDPVDTLCILFLGSPPNDCPRASDSNHDGLVDIGDVLYSLRFLYLEFVRSDVEMATSTELDLHSRFALLLGEHDLARTVTAAWERKQPGDPAPPLRRAQVEMAAGAYLPAHRAAERALTASPADLTALEIEAAAEARMTGLPIAP